jgi:hypothetical protein
MERAPFPHTQKALGGGVNSSKRPVMLSHAFLAFRAQNSFQPGIQSIDIGRLGSDIMLETLSHPQPVFVKFDYSDARLPYLFHWCALAVVSPACGSSLHANGQPKVPLNPA